MYSILFKTKRGRVKKLKNVFMGGRVGKMEKIESIEYRKIKEP
jgi:hypothetical protein